jgi:UDP-2,3-diacylglucosamine pyrophosphatase LpxH
VPFSPPEAPKPLFETVTLFPHPSIVGRLFGKRQMRIASFGDLHLGHISALDKFQGGEEEELLRFDDHLSRTHQRIVLMGDMYQTDYGTLPGSRPEVLEMIFRRYPRIVRRWQDTPYTSLFGNHDQIAQKRLGALKQIRLHKDGWRIWFIHGHQFDPFIGEKAGLPYYVTWMIGGLRRKGMKRLADFLEGPVYDFGQRLFKRLEGAARRAISLGQHQIVVMGHSHRLAGRSFGRGIYVNSGAPRSGVLPYTSIDTERRTVEIRVFTSPRGSYPLFRWREGLFFPKPFSWPG